MKARHYVYGVGLGLGDRLIPFVVKAGTVARGSVVKVLEEHEVSAPLQEASRLRNVLYRRFLDARKQEEAARKEDEARRAVEEREREELAARRAEEVGRFAVHADAQGHHLAILLDPSPDAFALFLTLRPGWAKQARRMTPDERAIVAPLVDAGTYLASVVRPRAQFSLRAGQLPAWRVEALLAEFPRSAAS